MPDVIFRLQRASSIAPYERQETPSASAKAGETEEWGQALHLTLNLSMRNYPLVTLRFTWCCNHT
jgi:hypothetical protein